VRERVGGMGGWVGLGMGLRVGFININDMYNNDVGQGVNQSTFYCSYRNKI
jgi:hypothetical protein